VTVRILVVEDNRELSDVLRDLLVEEGFAVDRSLDGEDGLWRATSIDYDAVVLDLLLPAVDGLEILRRMRADGKRAPVLLLTARDGTEDRVLGLDSGADDYLVKPFALEELLARVRALLRRGPHGTDGLLRHEGLVLDPASREVRLDGRPVDLTAKEFQVLHLLLSEPGKVFSRTELIDRLYDDEFDGVSNVIDVFLHRLRRKLARKDAPPLLRTVRGAGYALGKGSP
jgi:two-component system OmpR family response regulator